MSIDLNNHVFAFKTNVAEEKASLKLDFVLRLLS